MSKQTSHITKQEALELLSLHLRNPKTDDETLVKLMAMYSKLQGWDKPEKPAPADEVDIPALVAEIERRRKLAAQ